NTTTYHYDLAAPLDHFLTSISNAAGVTVLSATFDPNTGQLIGLTDADGHLLPISSFTTPLGAPAQQLTDPLGFTTTLVYDTNGNGNIEREIHQVQKADATTGTPALYSLVIRQFDLNNNVTSQSKPQIVDGSTM